MVYLDMQLLQTRSVWKQLQVREGLTAEVRARLLAGGARRPAGACLLWTGATLLVTRSSILMGFTS